MVAAGNGACHREHRRRDHRVQLRPRGGRDDDLADQRATAPARARAGGTAWRVHRPGGRRGQRGQATATRSCGPRSSTWPATTCRLAKTKTPAQMEALIWDKASSDGADHGPSCAAFASLTLELAAQAIGQQSWVTGGTSYPWPLPAWADVRVDTNPASPADHLRGGRRAGARALAPARRRLPAPARRLGPLRRPRRGRDQLLRRRPRHHRRRLAARPHRQRPLL